MDVPIFTVLRVEDSECDSKAFDIYALFEDPVVGEQRIKISTGFKY
ncbi:MAG: hypothetical protein ISS36_02590 [Candidatus Aenigmarchaeota archaeon]|nr:hypothetical protein [Candidatus Aenigmarchaeota archaeon]